MPYDRNYFVTAQSVHKGLKIIMKSFVKVVYIHAVLLCFLSWGASWLNPLIFFSMVMNAVLPACAVCSSNNYKKTTPKVHKAY